MSRYVVPARGDPQVPVQAWPGRDDLMQLGPRVLLSASEPSIISLSWASILVRAAASRSAPSGLTQITNRSS